MIKLITEHKDCLLLIDTDDKQFEVPVTKVISKENENSPFQIFSITGIYGNEVRVDNGISDRISWKNSVWKIIAHLPLNNASKLEGVPELPYKGLKVKQGLIIDETDTSYRVGNHWISKSFGIELPKQEEDVGQLANEACQFNTSQAFIWREGFMSGYKANTKKYSEKDMISAIELARKGFVNYDEIVPNYEFEHTTNEILQSLSPTLTPIGFEPEYIEVFNDPTEWNGKKVGYQQELKIVNGVLQGKWIFK